MSTFEMMTTLVIKYCEIYIFQIPYAMKFILRMYTRTCLPLRSTWIHQIILQTIPCLQMLTKRCLGNSRTNLQVIFTYFLHCLIYCEWLGHFNNLHVIYTLDISKILLEFLWNSLRVFFCVGASWKWGSKPFLSNVIWEYL